MARPSFATMETEVTRRLGGINYTGADSRIQEWIKTAYYECAITYHHHELDDSDISKTLAVNASSVSLPDDTYIVMGIELMDPSTPANHLAWLTPQKFHRLVSTFDDTKGQPKHYSRFSTRLHFDRRSSAAFPLTIHRYRLPDEPAFSGGGAGSTSELSPEFDQVIQEWAVAVAWSDLGRADLSGAVYARAQSFLERIPNAPLIYDSLPDRPGRANVDQSHGGGKT